MNSKILFQKAFTGLIVSLMVFGSYSCKKAKDSEAEIPVNNITDPMLTEAQYNTLDAASIGVTGLIEADSLTDMYGRSYKSVFSDPNWPSRMDSLKSLVRIANSSISESIKQDLNNMLTFGLSLTKDNEDESKIRPFVSDITPKQMAYAYVAGVRQLSVAQFPTAGNAIHRSFKLIGTDCSGFLFCLLKIAAYNPNNFAIASFPNNVSLAVGAKYSSKAELLNLGLLDKEKFKKGDFVVWPEHGGILQVDGRIRLVYQSNGRFSDPTVEQQKANFTWKPYDVINPSNKGINAKKFDWMISPNRDGTARWPTNYTIYRIVPIIDKSLKASGDAQKGLENKKLPQPLKVKVLDKNGEGIPGLEIEFSVLSGGGSVSKSKVETKEDGTAEVEWTLGTKIAGNQKVKVRTKNFKGEYVVNGDLEFTATFDESTCPATVTDIDGNVYPTVSIGTQCWMKTNLKTTLYRDGSTIYTGLSNSAWGTTTSGAYAIYDNNAANNDIYGKLYNFYAVADPRGLCPTGWHVPSDAEWTTLENFLGGATVAGGKLKAVSGLWTSPNTDATDESGFSALPGGFRTYYIYGDYSNVGNNGYWWESSETYTDGAWNWFLNSNYGSSYRRYFNKQYGFSVRCLRD